jgi:iron uptake system component EfeO
MTSSRASRVQAGGAAMTALLAGLTLPGCAAKHSDTANPTDGNRVASQITVTASDTACQLSGTTAVTGSNTFVITNNGSKITEFYVYGAGDRVMGEVENISPGLQRKLIVQLTEPGKYQTACKPGMIGDGLRGDFTVTGDAVRIDTQASSRKPPTTTGGTSTARPTP